MLNVSTTKKEQTNNNEIRGRGEKNASSVLCPLQGNWYRFSKIVCLINKENIRHHLLLDTLC